MKGYFQTSRKHVCVCGSVCMCVCHLLWNSHTTGKYGYGNIGQDVCL